MSRYQQYLSAKKELQGELDEATIDLHHALENPLAEDGEREELNLVCDELMMKLDKLEADYEDAR